MEKRKVIALGLMVLMMLGGCSEGDNEDSYMDMPNADENVFAVFEGVWSIDDTPIEQTFPMACQTNGSQPFVKFPSLPYKAIVNRVMGGKTNHMTLEESMDKSEEDCASTNDVNDFSIVEPVVAPTLTLSPVGYSSTANYYGQASSTHETYEPLSFGMTSADEGTLTVTLGMLPGESTFVIGETAANCLLVVKRVIITYPNSGQRTWVLDPEMRMAFISTKRLK